MGKTITTYLIDGDPKGAQYVLISNKICKMVVVPRANLSIVNQREELQTPAFYILLGEDDAMKHILVKPKISKSECVTMTRKRPFGKKLLFSYQVTER